VYGCALGRQNGRGCASHVNVYVCVCTCVGFNEEMIWYTGLGMLGVGQKGLSDLGTGDRAVQVSVSQAVVSK
jgi:hypothetical protein